MQIKLKIGMARFYTQPSDNVNGRVLQISDQSLQENDVVAKESQSTVVLLAKKASDFAGLVVVVQM
jgi:hypothetical protein